MHIDTPSLLDVTSSLPMFFGDAHRALDREVEPHAARMSLFDHDPLVAVAKLGVRFLTHILWVSPALRFVFFVITLLLSTHMLVSLYISYIKVSL